MFNAIACFFIAAFLSLAWLPQLEGQSLHYRHFGVEDGLPHSTVFRIHEDARGFVWLGTKSGVSRFDGHRFENFEEYGPLRSRQVLGLSTSKAGTLWVCDYAGSLHSFDKSGFRLFPFDTVSIQTGQDNVAGAILPRTVVRFFAGGDEQFYFASRGTFWSLRKGEMQPFSSKHFGDDNRSIVFSKVGLYLGSDERVYLTAENGVYRFVDGEFLRLFPDIVGDRPVYAIIEDRQGNFLLGMEGGVTRILRGGGYTEYRPPWLKGKVVNVIKTDAHDRVWFCGDGLGLCVIEDDEARELSSLLKEGKTPLNDQINDICVDRENNIWLATNSSGVYLIPYEQVSYYNARHGLSHQNINCVVSDARDRIWISTMDGVYYRQDGEFNRLPLNLPAKIKGERRLEIVEAMGLDSAGNLWMSAVPNTLLKVNPSGRKPVVEFAEVTFTVHGHEDTVVTSRDTSRYKHLGPLGFFRPYAIYTDPVGTLFMSAYNNLYTSPNLDKGISSWDSIPGLLQRPVRGIVRHPNGDLWLGTHTGVYRHSRGAHRQFTRADGLPGDTVVGLSVDSKGRIWGVSSNGAFCISGDSIRAFSEKEGLSHHHCTSVVSDNNGGVWIGTSNGLNCYSDGAFIHINSKRGLSSNEIQALHVDKDNTLWVGTTRGINYLSPIDFVVRPRAAPGVFIGRVFSRDSVVLEPDAMTLSYNSSDVRIDYSAGEYPFPEGVSFQYKMLPEDEHWRETREWKREYQSLPSGRNEFIVRARLDNGPWSTEPARLVIEVTPPWWETLWFRLCAAVAFLALGYTVHKVRLNRINKREAEKRRVLEIENKLIGMELRALNLSMSPHFLANALNSIQYYFNTDTDRENANNYLSKFGSLIRQVLGDTHNDVITLDDELDRLQLYLQLEEVRMGERLRWSFEIAEGVETDLIRVPVMLIQPYVENAIWHGISPLKTAGEVRVSIQPADNDRLLICITDNGIGIRNSRNRRSKYSEYRPRQGMQFTRDRLKLMEKTGKSSITLKVSELDPTSQDRPGTRVEIYLPKEYTRLQES